MSRFSTLDLSIKKHDVGGGGVKLCLKLRDVIYGRPFNNDLEKKSHFFRVFFQYIKRAQAQSQQLSMPASPRMVTPP